MSSGTHASGLFFVCFCRLFWVAPFCALLVRPTGLEGFCFSMVRPTGLEGFRFSMVCPTGLEGFRFSMVCPTGLEGFRFSMVCPTGPGGDSFLSTGSPNGSGRVSDFIFNGLPNGPRGGFVFKYWFAQRVWAGFGFYFQWSAQRARGGGDSFLSTGSPGGSAGWGSVFF